MHMELMAPICNNLDLPPCRAFMWSSHPRHHISKVLSLLLPASLMYTICGFFFATSLLSHSEKVAHSIANQLENMRLKYKEQGNPAGWLFGLFSCSDDREVASTQHQQALLIANRTWSACHCSERKNPKVKTGHEQSESSSSRQSSLMASVEPVHGGERTTAAGGVDTLTVLTVCQALCRVLCTYSPPSPLSSLQKAVCRTVRASALGAPLAQVQPECSCCCHHFLSCLPSGQALFLKKKKKVYLFIWLYWVFIVSRGIFSVWRSDSVLMACGLSCSVACGILVPQPDIDAACPALHGRFLTSGPPGKKSQGQCLCWVTGWESQGDLWGNCWSSPWGLCTWARFTCRTRLDSMRDSWKTVC